MELSKGIERELLKAFHNRTTEFDWFPIWSETLNDYLHYRFLPPCDSEEVIYKLSNAYSVKFDWAIGVWRVSAITN